MNRLELVKNELDAVLLNRESTNDRPVGYLHLYGVANFCTLLAIKRKLDVELCAIIGLLHDIHTYKNGYSTDHAKMGAVEAENLLLDLDIFNEQEIEIIRNAISNHSDKNTKHDKYSELLKDADVLQNTLYDNFETKHKKRFKKIAKSLGIEVKMKKIFDSKFEIQSN